MIHFRTITGKSKRGLPEMTPDKQNIWILEDLLFKDDMVQKNLKKRR